MIYFDNFVTNKGNSISDVKVYHSLRKQRMYSTKENIIRG
jgi:hypothetical protein